MKAVEDMTETERQRYARDSIGAPVEQAEALVRLADSAADLVDLFIEDRKQQEARYAELSTRAASSALPRKQGDDLRAFVAGLLFGVMAVWIIGAK